jgi:hypothetical protein
MLGLLCSKFEELVAIPSKRLRDLLLKWSGKPDVVLPDAEAQELLTLANRHCKPIEDFLQVVER